MEENELKTALAACLTMIDAEIDERKHSGNDEDWSELQAISDRGHAALSDH